MTTCSNLWSLCTCNFNKQAKRAQYFQYFDCSCGHMLWRRSLSKEATLRNLFLPRPGSFPGRIWPNKRPKWAYIAHLSTISKQAMRFWVFGGVAICSEEEVCQRRGPSATYFCPALDPPLGGSDWKRTALMRNHEYQHCFTYKDVKCT